MSTIRTVRDALYDLVDGIDISEVVAEWEYKGKHPPKQQVYPGFWVEPVSNVAQTLDSVSNESTFTFWISLTESYEDAALGEDTSIDLADLVYQSVLVSAKSSNPFGASLPAVFDGTPSGQWGFEERYGARVYRIEVAVRVIEDIYEDLAP